MKLIFLMVILKEWNINMNKILLNLREWKRYDEYQFYRHFLNPYSQVTSEVTFHSLVDIARSKNLSFYGIMSYLVLYTLNSIEDFHIVFDNDQIYRYDNIDAFFTTLDCEHQIWFSDCLQLSDFEQFIIDFEKMKHNAEMHIKQIRKNKDNNVVYLTCVPWVKISSLLNPYDKFDSIPRICWGKYYRNDDAYSINISIQFNHAFVDGWHIGQFFNTLQSNIHKFERTYEYG